MNYDFVFLKVSKSGKLAVQNCSDGSLFGSTTNLMELVYLK